jgi:hypothetical protein
MEDEPEPVQIKQEADVLTQPLSQDQDMPDPISEPPPRKRQRLVQHPEYNLAQPYTPRADRPAEYSCVGIHGQVLVNVDSTVVPDQCVAASVSKPGLGTLAPESSHRLYCMKITVPYQASKGYGIALCLLT